MSDMMVQCYLVCADGGQLTEMTVWLEDTVQQGMYITLAAYKDMTWYVDTVYSIRIPKSALKEKERINRAYVANTDI